MRLKFLTYRQSQIYIFTHVHKEVNTFMNSDSVAKKKNIKILQVCQLILLVTRVKWLHIHCPCKLCQI